MLNNLTFARFLAALLVVFHHAPQVLQDPAMVPPAPLRLFFANGYVGVTFFFILSGFVISSASFERLRRPSLGETLTFFARRAIRIVPVWLLLSLPFVMPAFFAKPPPDSLWRFLTFTQAWSPERSVATSYLAVAWTLSCEMFFYAMFPLTAYIMGRLEQRHRDAGVCLMLLAPTASLAAYLVFYFGALHTSLSFDDPNGPHRWLYLNPAARFFEFLLGVGMFLVFRRRIEALRASPRIVWTGALFVAVVVLVILMSQLPISPATLTLTYIVPFAAIVFCLAAIEINAKPLAVRAPLLILLGEASYSLYLAHQQYGLPAFQRLSDNHMPRVGLALAIALTVALSIGLYTLVEAPTRLMLNGVVDRIRRRWSRPAVCAQPCAQPQEAATASTRSGRNEQTATPFPTPPVPETAPTPAD